MKDLPKISHGLYTDYAKGAKLAFDECDPNLIKFYNTLHTKLWEQYKTCIEVTSWIYISKHLGPPTIVTGATGYAFYQYLFSTKSSDASDKKKETEERKNILETTKDMLQEYLSKAAKITTDGIKSLIQSKTGIPIKFMDDNQETIIGVLKGLSFSLAAGWLAYSTVSYNSIKTKADNYLKIFYGNTDVIENIIGNIAEYTTLRFSSLIEKITSSEEIEMLANRLLKQFAYKLGQGKPPSIVSNKKFIIDSIAPIKSEMLDAIWKKKYVCICPCTQDKTLSLNTGKKITYEEFATKSPLTYIYKKEDDDSLWAKVFELNNSHRNISIDIPTQKVIGEDEVIDYGFNVKKFSREYKLSKL